MPFTKTLRPPAETESSESKAHERGESPEEEIREGSEDAPRSRKRRARGSKSTKAPMDSECGCSGGKGKKCTCDGGCSGSKKMDAALTPYEYLDACDLGIQGRSNSYIRTRLMTQSSARADKKCGNSSIPDDRQCRAGGVMGKVATGAAIAGGAAAAYGAFKHRKQISATASNVASRVRSAASNGMEYATSRSGKRDLARATRPVRRTVRRARTATTGAVTSARSTAANAASSVRSAASNGMEYATSRAGKRDLARATRPARRAVRRVGSSVSRVGTSVRSRFSRDSVWAVGFEPGDFQ